MINLPNNEVPKEPVQAIQEDSSQPFKPVVEDDLSSNPFMPQEQGQVETKQLRENMAMYDAVVQLSENNKPPAETYQLGLLVPAAATKDKLITENQQRNMNAVNGAIDKILAAGANESDPAGLLMGVPELNKEIQDNSAKPWAAQRAVIDAMDRYVGQEDGFKDRAALNMWYYDEHIAGLADEIGLNLETASNVAGLLLLSDESIDISRVVGSFFGSAEGWNRYISAFHGMEPDEQAAAFLHLKSAISEATDGNTIKTMLALTQLLDPNSATEVNVTHALDKLGLVSYLADVGMLLRNVRKLTTIMKVADKVNNPALVVKIATEASSSPDAAKAFGLDRVDVAGTVSPFNMEGMLDGATDGYAKDLNDQFNKMDAYLKDTQFLDEGLGITVEERMAAVDARVAELNAQPMVDNITVEASDGLGYTISFDKTVGAAQERSVESRRYVQDDITGGFKANSLTPSHTAMAAVGIPSPDLIFKKDGDLLVQAFTRMTFATDKVRNHFNGALKAAVAPIKGNGVSVEKLDNILLLGDEQGEVFSYEKLVNTGIDGVRMTPTEYTAYANLRNLMDQGFILKNKEVRDGLVAQGLKEVNLGGKATISKPYRTIQGAQSAIRVTKFKHVYIEDDLAGASRVANLDNEMLKDYYDKGYILTKSMDNDYYKISSDNYSKYMLVKDTEIRDVPQTVLNQPVGYIPRDHKDGLYFVKVRQRGNVDGTNTVIGLKTERYFDNKIEANAFAKAMQAKSATPDDIHVLHNREMLQTEFEKEGTGIGGKLYTSSRKSEALLMGTNGVKGPRVDAMESISRYFTTMAKRIPMVEFRLGVTRRWLNGAKEAGAIPQQYSGSFADAFDKILETMPLTQRAFFKSSHKQIQFQLGIPTAEEQAMANLLRSSAEWMEDKKWFGAKTKQVAKSMHRFDNSDPVAAAKAATFHTFLGVGSPVQFFIQGLGSTVAMSIDPIHAARGFPGAMGLSLLDNLHNPAVLNLHKARLAKSADHPSEMHGLWRKTGLYESVVASNGDLDAMAKGYHIGKAQIASVMDKGLFSFKAGELFNRRVSFATAYHWWKANNKGKAIGDDQLKEILTRTNMYLLNMSKANKAGFQKGMLGIPTQFMQVHSKFMELALGSKLTTQERFKLLGNQALIFGAAGIPLSSFFVDDILEKAGFKPGELSEPVKDAVREGMLTSVTQNFLEVDVSVAGRTAIAAGLDDLFIGFLESKGTTWEIALGAFGGLAERGSNAVSVIYNLGSTSYNGGDELDTAVWKGAVDALFDITTTWSNASAAIEISKSKLLRNTKGQVVAEIQGVNVQTLIAMGVGFKHSKLEAIYEGNLSNMKRKERIIEKSDAYMKIVTILLANAEDTHKAAVYDAVWNSMTSSMVEEDRKELYGMIGKRLRDPSTKEERLIKEEITQYINGQSTKSDILNSLLPELEQ